MDTPDHANTPPTNSPTPSPSDQATNRLLSRLQGEDGYEIFADDHGPDARQRLKWEQEDNRW